MCVRGRAHERTLMHTHVQSYSRACMRTYEHSRVACVLGWVHSLVCVCVFLVYGAIIA